MDVILIHDGRAREVFAGRTLSEMSSRFAPDLVAAMVEVESDSVAPGDVWDGSSFAPEPPPAVPPPSADDVRAECSRRMQAMVGARDADHLSIIIQNANREATRLQAIRIGIPGVIEGRDWTGEEAQRAAQLYGADAALEAIRAASNVLEVMDPVPSDYADDRWWPE